MLISRRSFVSGSSAVAMLSPRVVAAPGGVFRPEQFGARGDGISNDSCAFAALSAEVNRRGGGTIILGRHRTYVIGRQQLGGDYGWTPLPVLEFRQLSRPLYILGNGARLRCASGLRYGTFDPVTGVPVQRPMPNDQVSEVATPYRAMIFIGGCSGPVEVRDIDLDGNVERLEIGGPFGDVGWQIPATGLILEENIGPETISNVLSQRHAQDGAIVIGAAERRGRGRISRLAARYNGRQGLSMAAGCLYDFEDCEFSHTGRSKVRSAPGAGVDIEAERRPIRNVTFTRCKFVDNAGIGMVADSGDSQVALFTDCLFVGSTTWSAWPYKPHFTFRGCTFVGAVVHAFSDPDPTRATRFIDCDFTDDPSRSPSGKVYLGNGPIVNLAVSDNVLFDACIFRLVNDGTLPWTWRAIYRNCTMSQRSPVKATPKGRYVGRSTISGNVDLYGSMIQGELTVNGAAIAQGSQGGPPW